MRPARAEPSGLLVLHHGRGSDEQDLIGLAPVLDPEERLHVVAPRAPLRLRGSPGYHWYLVPRVGYARPRHASVPPTGRWPPFHDELWERTGDRPDPHRAGRLLDGDRDELRARPGQRAPGADRHPRAVGIHPHCRGVAARRWTTATDMKILIAHGVNDRRDPGDVRPPCPGPARAGWVRRRLPGVERGPQHRPARPRAASSRGWSEAAP